MGEEFDSVIVGAGSAGCVLARRLIERGGARVLLLEAGGPDELAAVHATDLGSMTSLWGNPETAWQHVTMPQPGLAGRTVPLPQGRGLGGGSSINAMMYVRGNQADFDGWYSEGNPGWSYTEVLPYFRRAEDFADGASRYRGVDGPLSVVHYERPSIASEAFRAAAVESGRASEVDLDYNGGRQDGGAFLYQSTRTKDNQRASTAVGYLAPVLEHPDLTVRTGAYAHRLLIEAGVATGVEYFEAGSLRQVRATAEVLLCAGALASPQLLMLSGIGPADHLSEHGIAALVDLPGVGANLSDHLLFGVGYQALVELSPPALLSEAGLFTRSDLDPADYPPDQLQPPDLQFFFGPVQFLADRYKIDGPGFTFAPILIQPASRGTVRLASSDPTALPLVDPHYLTREEDLAVLLRGLEITRELVNTSAFDGIRGRELAPGELITDREQLARYIRDNASTVWHPVGTCRMGSGPETVVDARLQVHGVRSLRVVDASVMPTITRGNTNAATIMIAEKAADLLARADQPVEGSA